ncbi:hypothetical protein [Singulisphaera acidiphila]|uniref:Uncharacterized protein n=1 Tax=Singulisphaera acidiphila (strain ATCC BAA-1392 / DSM 18658 / VKM B-2454 / MOB10) TaxID=886293 RepID=L0D9E7_SINAD|nr:hypothetical protein [Singulisphaera acidiphila]AGA26014.1 hypothetical protein Sinac_1636 [Singulisphaera acidiphila DSM 18658]
MSHADRESTKQNIIRAGRCVMEVAMAREGAYTDHDAAFLLGGAVYRLSRLVQDYRDKSKSLRSQEKTKFVSVDDFKFTSPNENDRCVRLMEEILGKILDRWRQERREFFLALKDYYDRWILDDEGNPIEGPPDRPELPCVEESRIVLSQDEIDGLRAVIARFELAEDMPGLPSAQPQSHDAETQNQASITDKRSRNEDRDEFIYDEYVKGTPSKEIVSQFSQHGWKKFGSSQGPAQAVRGAVRRFALRRNLPIPNRGQGINHRLSRPECN